jgi:hypothetical protein
MPREEAHAPAAQPRGTGAREPECEQTRKDNQGRMKPNPLPKLAPQVGENKQCRPEGGGCSGNILLHSRAVLTTDHKRLLPCFIAQIAANTATRNWRVTRPYANTHQPQVPLVNPQNLAAPGCGQFERSHNACCCDRLQFS